MSTDSAVPTEVWSLVCLLAVIHKSVPGTPVLVLANREEAYSRPGTPPQRLPGGMGQPDWVGGIDPVAGGTWLGVNAAGLLVAVTNRKKSRLLENLRSRGLLCRDLLAAPSAEVARDLVVSALQGSPSGAGQKAGYAGCNFLLVDRETAWVVQAGDQFCVTALSPGLHLITNGALNDPTDARIDRVRRELSKSPPETLAEWRLRGEKICSARAESGEPAICLEGTEGGTVSASIIAYGGDPHETMYWHAAGPPCRTSFIDWSPLLQSLLQSAELPAPASKAEPYRITLRGPWEYELLDADRKSLSVGKLRFPLADPDPLNGHRGYVRWSRRFHRPTNLTTQDRVLLAFTGVGGRGRVTLNDTVIGELSETTGTQSFDITSQLRGEEELLVELQPSSNFNPLQPAGAFVSVVVEIHSEVSA